jgi:hypothetical protein
MAPSRLLWLCVHLAAAERLSSHNRTLLLDGVPHLLRAVLYSPTLWGYDNDLWFRTPYYGSAYPAIFERDLDLMSALGANAVRIHGFFSVADSGQKHAAFLDTAAAKGLSVLVSYDLVGHGDRAVQLATCRASARSQTPFAHTLMSTCMPSRRVCCAPPDRAQTDGARGRGGGLALLRACGAAPGRRAPLPRPIAQQRRRGVHLPRLGRRHSRLPVWRQHRGICGRYAHDIADHGVAHARHAPTLAIHSRAGDALALAVRSRSPCVHAGRVCTRRVSPALSPPATDARACVPTPLSLCH